MAESLVNKAARFSRACPPAGNFKWRLALLAVLPLLCFCGRHYSVILEKNDIGEVFVHDQGTAGQFIIASHTRDELTFKKKPGPEEIEQVQREADVENPKPEQRDNFLGARPVSGGLDLYLLNKGRKELCLENFIVLDPTASKGILESAPAMLLKGDQNLGKIGLLLPLYNVGFESADWAVYNKADRKLYSLGRPGEPSKALDLPLRPDGKEGLYRGEREYAITSPALPFVATLSHSGKMALFSWPDGKKIREENGVYSFCFHPSKRILYIGSKKGLAALSWEVGGSCKEALLSRRPVRMMRISSKGSYLFTLPTGGAVKPAIIALTDRGLYKEEPLELGKVYGEARDWVWLDDRTLLLVFRYTRSAFIWELDVRKGEYTETILDPDLQDVSVISGNVSPSVAEIKKISSDKKLPPNLLYYDPGSRRYTPLEGLPQHIATFPSDRN